MHEPDEHFVRKRVEECNSHAVISEELQTMLPVLRGLSERSVRRFCTDRGISRRCSLTKEELERCVCAAVSEVSTSHISFWFMPMEIEVISKHVIITGTGN